MLDITVSNRNIFPRPKNYIFLYEAPETVLIKFQFNTKTQLIEIIDLFFPSNQFIFNSQRDKLLEAYKGKNLSQFQYLRFNRETFFLLNEDDKFRYICIDAACKIVRDYGIQLDSSQIIFYLHDEIENSISARVKKPFSHVMNSDENNEEIPKSEYDEIGILKVFKTEDGLIWLDYIEVDENYRHKGIAAAMLALAIDYLDMNAVPCVKEADAYKFYLTENGEQFIADCLINNIINCNMCYFSTISNYQSSKYILNKDAQYDPGNDSEIIMQLNIPELQQKTIESSGFAEKPYKFS